MPAGGEPVRFTDVRRRDETDSTNREVLELVRAGAPEGVVVVADHQSAGRGRRGRAWIAPPGSALLASVLLRPPLPAASAPLAAMAVALAASDACQQVAGVRPSLKWPNDLVVENANCSGKLAGILAESLVEGEVLAAVVVGMGCNVTAAAATMPGAVCLEALAGRPVERQALLDAWLDHLERWYSSLLGVSGQAIVLEAYRKRCATLGRWVRLELAQGAVEGQAMDVTESGALVVEKASGRRTFSVGDVVHLR